MPAMFRDLLRRPLVGAPMGGGPSTASLVPSACEAGALAGLAGAYKTAEAMAVEIAAVRSATRLPFGVNLFVPGQPAEHPAEVAAYLGSPEREAADRAASVGEPVWDDDGWEAKVAVLLADPPPFVSCTLGCPPRDVVAAVCAAGSVVAITVTDPEEARLAAAAGADCPCVQAIEAGAHRATFTNGDHPAEGHALLPLIRAVGRVADLPLIAAGGLMTADAVAAVLAQGAAAAQCGTAFLRCPESGAHPAPRFGATTITRAFSGRPARGLVNRFMPEHVDAPPAYPEIHNATRPIRAATADAGDVDRMSLWAGGGHGEAVALPAGAVVDFRCP